MGSILWYYVDEVVFVKRFIALALIVLTLFAAAGCGEKISDGKMYYNGVKDNKHPHLFAYEREKLIVFNLSYDEYTTQMSDADMPVSGTLNRGKVFQILSLGDLGGLYIDYYADSEKLGMIHYTTRRGNSNASFFLTKTAKIVDPNISEEEIYRVRAWLSQIINETSEKESEEIVVNGICYSASRYGTLTIIIMPDGQRSWYR
jgi:hypothetical protein